MMKTAFVAVLFVFLSSLSFADSGAIIDSTESTVNLYFTGSAGGPETWYQDALSGKGNPDATLNLCDAGQRYVGAVYCIDDGGTTHYALITYKSATEPLAYTNTATSGSCYKVSPEGNLWFSPSALSLTPPVYYAAFPGIPCILHSGDSSGSNPQFVTPENVSGSLRGAYSVGRSYTQSTDTLSVSTPSITFQFQGGSTTQSAASATFGINSDRRMAIGVCIDQYGANCNDGLIKSDTAFPISLSVGVTPLDSVTYDRYVVINGLDYLVCIGANLQTSNINLNVSEIYYNQTLQINYTIRNYRDTPDENQGGNVEVTTNFDARIEILNSSMVTIDSWIDPINDNIVPGASVTKTTTWKAAVHSGTYYVKVTADYNNAISECVESDNDRQQSFAVKAVTIAETYINGVQSDTFPYAGRPYNFTLHMRNSDDENVSNATIQMVEENGISLLGPTQVWNRSIDQYGNTTKAGLKAKNIAEFKTDYYGDLSVTVIPTGNRLYSDEYNYTNISSYVGDYSLYLQGTDSSDDILMFLVGGNSVQPTFPFTVTNLSHYEPGSQADFQNEDTYVKQVMDWSYSIFSNFWNMVTT